MGSTSPAAIAIFCFNRPEHTRRMLESLSVNKLAQQSELTAFCDGARNSEEQQKTAEVQEIVRSAKGFKSVRVVAREKNMGCAASIITGVNEIFRTHDRIIVIEDDILTSPSTLHFLNAGLDYYEKYQAVFNITAWAPPLSENDIPADYPYDVFFTPRFNGWGWGMWKNRWEQIDFGVSDYEIFKNTPYIEHAYQRCGKDLPQLLHKQLNKKINSWGIRADYARFKLGLLGVSPFFTYTANFGWDGTGTHCTPKTAQQDQTPPERSEIIRFPGHIITDPGLLAVFKYSQSHQHRKVSRLKKWYVRHFRREV